MINPESTSSDDAIRFPSLESLRATHTELLKRFSFDSRSGMVAEVEAFIRRGKATGALLDADADRWAVQSQLDYWAIQLYRPGYEPPDATLDEFDPQIAPKLDDWLCPYMGLDSFHEANQSVFFGRGRLVAELVNKLKATRFLPVLGPSGSGKSSLVRAGLIPALKKHPLSGDVDWTYLAPMVPGSNPLVNLVRLMMPEAGPIQVQAETNRFKQSDARLSQLLSEQSNNVVLVVDQFEEVFTLCADEMTRHAFVDNLIQLSRSEDRQDRVIITMRTDFETNIARLLNLQPIFEHAAERITPLNASELREAIVAPATRIGLKFEEGVVESLLNDTLGEPAALPLLQFTLLKLWENRERNRITWEAYRKLGGGRLALSRSADEFYSRLIPEEQVTMRRILLKMVRPGEGLEVTSYRVPRAALYNKTEANDRIDRVLGKLIQARLLRVSEGDVAADEQVEIAHEALIRNWPRLVEWLEEERVTLRQRQRLTTAAEEWERLGREEAVLWRGILLNEARHYNDLNQLETEFVEAGYKAEQAENERRLEEVQRQKELEYTKKLAETEKLRAEEQAQSASRLRQRSLYLSVALGIALVAVLVAIFFNVQARNATSLAQKQAQIARIGELAAQSTIMRDAKLDVSLLLGIEVFNQLDNNQTRGVLLNNIQANPYLLQFLRGHRSNVNSVAFSPDGKTIASGSNDGTIILWDIATRQPVGKPLAVGIEPVTSLAFSPHGKFLASGRGNGGIILWDLGTHKSLPQTLRGHTNSVNSMSFSPDGKILVSASFDKTIILWDVATWKPIGKPLSGHQGWVTSVAFSPDGNMIASGSFDNTVRMWDVRTQKEIGHPLRGHNEWVWSVVFSPDGRKLASGSNDGTIILWDIATEQQTSQMFGEPAGVISLALSRDGKTLASGNLAHTITLWDVETQQPIGEPLHGHTGVVSNIAFSPDGELLASGGGDATVILWSVKKQTIIGQVLHGHADQVTSIAYSPDGKILASSSGDSAIILWNTVTHQQIGRPLHGHTAWISSIAFSQDGKFLASAGEDKTVILWDVLTQKQIGQPLYGHTKWIESIAFSPDGQILASGSGDGSIILWNIASQKMIGQPMRSSNEEVWTIGFSPDGKMLASGSLDSTITLWDVKSQKTVGLPLRGHTDQLRSLAFSPDGKTLASGSLDQTVILWDVASQKMIGQPLRGHQNFIYDVAFSPDGKTVASASFDQTIILWDVASHQPIGQPLRGHSSVVWSVAFSPDSKTLASAGGDRTIILWTVNAQSWNELACQRVGRNFTHEEWMQFFPNEEYRKTCEQWPIEQERVQNTSLSP